MATMKPNLIEELIERVKAWPESAQGDLAQAVLEIEADIERGMYGATYTPTPEEAEELRRRIKELDDGTVEPVSYDEIKAVFAKYRR
ncbi:MAG: hypothetical protein ACRECX_13000 [Methyloceanibacter sp.]|uniref:hypothetical protein n=1 Tax=Methyloceanibacter sp. TaxID=1965321 RepID=UPI003D6D1200